MVLIAAAIFSKTGKGLVDAFPKLVIGDKGTQKQHTYIETDAVRYVYQPMDLIYMVLITTKNSNIMEDLETLRLFARIIPEYCRSNDETEVFNNVFELIAAFDEVVVLGYRESVNLAQIRTFTEMDSHEERIFNQIQIAQQRVAKNNMLEKAKEMKNKKKLGGAAATGFQGGFGRNASSGPAASPAPSFKAPVASFEFGQSSDSYKANKPKASGGGKALKLGAKAGAEDNFMQQLREEGQVVTDGPTKHSAVVESAAKANVHREAVHLKAVEKVTAQIPRGGGLDSAEIQGSVALNVSDPSFSTVTVHVKSNSKSGVQLQVHPNLDKKAWQAESVLRLKSTQKPFPVNVDVGVLKWRIVLADEDDLPLQLVCWPNESANGCSVNVEYTLQREDLVLEDLQVSIPLPPSTVPIVSECDGEYEYLRSKSCLLWSVASVDESNKSGTIEFEVPNGDPDHFFPVNVKFHSEKLYAGLQVENVTSFDGQDPVTFSEETRLTAENYQVL